VCSACTVAHIRKYTITVPLSADNFACTVLHVTCVQAWRWVCPGLGPEVMLEVKLSGIGHCNALREYNRAGTLIYQQLS